MALSQHTQSPKFRAFRLAALQHGLVSLEQLWAYGVPTPTVNAWSRAGDIERVRRGVYVFPGFPPSFEQDALAAVLAVGASAIASHHTAARLHGLDGFDTQRALHLTTARDQRPVGTTTHRVPRPIAAQDRTKVSGVPVTSVTRTLVDLAGSVPGEQLEMALEDALRRRLTSWALCRKRIVAIRGPGRRGPAQLEAVLARRGRVPPTESLAETIFLQLVRRAGLPEPVRQHQVGKRRLDFAWPLVLFAAEVDGAATHAGAEALAADLHRQNAIILSGWTLLRYAAARVPDTRSHPAIEAELRRAWTALAA